MASAAADLAWYLIITKTELTNIPIQAAALTASS
jgi:hypothetical protein